VIKPIVGFLGMSHLGLVSATATASLGFETVCFDLNSSLILELRGGKLPIVEPGLLELMLSNGVRQSYTSSITDLARCDVVYVATDVATDHEGRSDTSAQLELIELITPVLNKEAVLVVLSQVEPGFTRAMREPGLSRRIRLRHWYSVAQ